MIQVISQKYLGMLHSCCNCGALLKYTPADIYDKKYIYCPVCKEKQECALQINYDGIVSKEKEKIING